MIRLLGEQAAKFFGFKVEVGSQKMTVPDADELNGAIEKINELMAEANPEFSINIGFYEQNSQILKIYMREFSETGGLPIAVEHPSRSHDLSHHVPSIFLPSVVVRKARQLNTIVEQLTEDLIDEFRGARHEQAARNLAKAMIFVRARQVDQGTGSVMLYFRNAIANNSALPLKYPIMEILGDNKYEGQQTAEDKESAFRRMTNKRLVRQIFKIAAGQFKDNMNYQMPEEQYDPYSDEAIALLNSAKFNRFWDRWMKQYEAAHPTFDKNLLPALEELCQHMLRKMLMVSEYAGAISSK